MNKPNHFSVLLIIFRPQRFHAFKSSTPLDLEQQQWSSLHISNFCIDNIEETFDHEAVTATCSGAAAAMTKGDKMRGYFHHWYIHTATGENGIDNVRIKCKNEEENKGRELCA